MEENIERLRQSIKSNSNLSDTLKANIGTLTDTLLTVYPNYDCSNLEKILSSLNIIANNNLSNYSMYDSESNSLNLNTDKILEDRIDIQHLFLNDMLEMNSRSNTGYEGFKRGLTEVISSTMNNDESMKKLNPQELILMSIFTKIVDPEILISSYMNGSIADIIIYLDSIGISKEEFDNLSNSFNGLNERTENNTSFVDAEVQMIDMFGRKVQSEISNGITKYEDLSLRFGDFGEMLIYNRSELISIYPHHDFSNLSGFEKVKESLDRAVVNSEIIDLEERVK